MDGLFWNCIYRYKNQLYFANHSEGKTVISDGLNIILECSKVGVNGCTYNGERLWVSIEGGNEIIGIDSQKSEQVIPFLSYDTVQIIKMVTGHKNLIVCKGKKRNKTKIFLFDGKKGCTRCLLPIENGYIDFVLESDQRGFLLCEESKNVPQRYCDEVPDTKILFFAEVAWKNGKIQADIVKSIRLYIDNNYDCNQKLMRDDPLRFPLFDMYLYHWLVQKSFSSYGKYVVYFSEDIKGIIIGNPVGGEIYRIISLPSKIANSNFGYFYNENTNELMVVSDSKVIHRYTIRCSSETSINALNYAYDEAVLNNINLASKRDTGDMSFTTILYRAMNSCICEPIGSSGISIRDDNKFVHVTLNMKTPISGRVILKQTGKKLGHIDCDLEEFEKTFEFDIEQESFTIIFETDWFKKEICLAAHSVDKALKVDIGGNLHFDEIKQCCNRVLARRKLQTFPTDIYAIYQLGWAGNEEDLNFLLGILEDHFTSSSLSFGNNGERVLNIVNAVFNLSVAYKRNDAIPFFRSIVQKAEEEGLTRISELVKQSCASLEEHKYFSSYKYRIDILVRTHLVTQLYLNSKENWLAEINGTDSSDKIIDWCSVRTNTKQFSLLVSTRYGDTVIHMDVQNNNLLSRQVIDVEPPVFSRNLSKKVLETRGDKVLAIPDGIEKLANDFALLFDEKNEKYHFYEIDIPASVTVIEPLFLTEDHGDTRASGKKFECFDEIVVSKENVNFCSVDGVLFTRNMKKLICYPCGKQEKIYMVPEGVETIGAFAFQCNRFLKSVLLPASIKKIERGAFSFCEGLSSIVLPEGIELIAEAAFEFCNIKHLTLPKSLKKIHWMNLSSASSGILNLEIPDAPIEIDMSDYDDRYENSYIPPLFLIKGKNPTFEKYARRHKKSIIHGYYTDSSGIIWSEDGKQIVEFPLHWISDTYHIPETVTSVHRWAFNQSDVTQIVATRNIEIKGDTSGNDFSRLASKDDFRFEHDFLVVEDSSEMASVDKSKIGKLILISGPSAARKELVARILVTENDNYLTAIMATSRACRAGEKNGVDYVFLTPAEFEKRIQEDCFIEYTTFAGDYYGTLKDSVYPMLKQGKNVILVVEFEGALQIKKQNTDALLVYIMPPDAKTTIERLSVREMNNERVRNRLAVYAREAYSALRGDILLINNDAATTAHVLASLVDDSEKAKEIYEENVELVVALKKEIERYLEPDVNEEQKFPVEKMMEYFRRFETMLGDIKKTGDDTNRKVTSLVHFVETDLQIWIAKNRLMIDDENLIEQFAHRAIDYINMHVQASNQKVQEEKVHLRSIFGNTWNRLLPTTQTSLVSAGVLWNLCVDISVEGFDYSGIIIAATSALESELKRVFYTDFQKYMVATYGDPSKQSAERTYALWPEKLLSKTKVEYDNEMSRGTASLPQLANNFTMGTLPYMFYDKNASQKIILQNRMKEYLRTIVNEKYYDAPLKAFNDYSDDNNFVKQCENIRTHYRNPAGHVDVLSRESAEECYTRIVGVGKVDAFRFTHEVQGLIMTLYGYLT